MPDDIRPIWRQCLPCDVRWLDPDDTPCWSCGGAGVSALFMAIPVCALGLDGPEVVA